MGGTKEIPANGVYLFFERGETVVVDSQPVERIVRVGTHRGEGRLPKRFLQHFAGNRRASVFRRHLGGALLARANPDDARIAVWVGQPGVPIPKVEQTVSQVVRERFTFCCVRVDDQAERLKLERGLIALLARHPLGPPSEGWLGRHAAHLAIRRSGLRNTQPVEARPLTSAGLARLTELAGLST